MQALSYQVIWGTLTEHMSVSDHTFAFIAQDEARRMNEAYQTDEYRVLVTMEDGTRRIA